MWDQVTVPFAKLLGSKLYPSLYRNKNYQEFLTNCGINPPYPDEATKLSTDQRTKLTQNANLQSHLLALELNKLEALKQGSATVVEITGPHPIYRLYNSEIGIFT